MRALLAATIALVTGFATLCNTSAAQASDAQASAAADASSIGTAIRRLHELHLEMPAAQAAIEPAKQVVRDARAGIVVAENVERQRESQVKFAQHRLADTVVRDWLVGTAGERGPQLLSSATNNTMFERSAYIESVIQTRSDDVELAKVAHLASLTQLQNVDSVLATARGALAQTRQRISDIADETSAVYKKLGELLSMPVGELNIPRAALDAYVNAVAIINKEQPGCDLPWWLLAGIGKVESNHGRGNYTANGTVDPPILGIVLDGSASLAISDTDGGLYDGDTVWDRAVGPMQFIPGTWNTSGRDGNGDGVRDPQNMYDATLAASWYVCRGAPPEGIASSEEGQRAALWSYNPKENYGDRVLGFATLYAQAGLPAGFSVSGIPTSSGE